MDNEYRNIILQGNVLDVLKQIPSEMVNCVITSPPYWSLRDYGNETETIWDADENCKHKWGNRITEKKRGSFDKAKVGNNKLGCQPKEINQGNFCIKCGAWKGQLGLEPTYELYLKHLLDIFDEVKRVLRKDGICFVNLGDSYGGSGNRSGHTPETSNLNKLTIGYGATNGNQANTKGSEKSLIGIPERFAIGMTDRGWIRRNTIIWHKKNCMPSSAKDRFTVDFEYVYFFAKSNKTSFWVNTKTKEIAGSPKPEARRIEGQDWEWIPCPRCTNKNYFNYRTRDVLKKEKDCPQFQASENEKDLIKNKICPRCKGIGKVKQSFWEGSAYFFEPQREKHKPESLSRVQRELDGHREPMSSYRGMHIANMCHPQGRNKRCVWQINTEGYAEAHFATFPVKLILPMLRAGVPRYVCSKCGKPRVKIYENTGEYVKHGGYGSKTADYLKVSPTSSLLTKEIAKQNFIGYSDCGCNAEFVPGIVLDPFFGSGTVGKGAKLLQMDYLGIEINPKYIEMAERRIKNAHRKPKKKLTINNSQLTIEDI